MGRPPACGCLCCPSGSCDTSEGNLLGFSDDFSSSGLNSLWNVNAGTYSISSKFNRLIKDDSGFGSLDITAGGYRDKERFGCGISRLKTAVFTKQQTTHSAHAGLYFSNGPAFVVISGYAYFADSDDIGNISNLESTGLEVDDCDILSLEITTNASYRNTSNTFEAWGDALNPSGVEITYAVNDNESFPNPRIRRYDDMLIASSSCFDLKGGLTANGQAQFDDFCFINGRSELSLFEPSGIGSSDSPQLYLGILNDGSGLYPDAGCLSNGVILDPDTSACIPMSGIPCLNRFQGEGEVCGVDTEFIFKLDCLITSNERAIISGVRSDGKSHIEYTSPFVSLDLATGIGWGFIKNLYDDTSCTLHEAQIAKPVTHDICGVQVSPFLTYDLTVVSGLNTLNFIDRRGIFDFFAFSTNRWSGFIPVSGCGGNGLTVDIPSDSDDTIFPNLLRAIVQGDFFPNTTELISSTCDPFTLSYYVKYTDLVGFPNFPETTLKLDISELCDV